MRQLIIRTALFFLVVIQWNVGYSQEQEKPAFYLPPVIKLPLDTSVWKIVPKTFRALPFFRNENLHRYSRVIGSSVIEFQTKYYHGSFEDYIADLPKNLYSTGEFIKGQTQSNWVLVTRPYDKSTIFVREIMPNCCVWVETTIRDSQENLLDEALKLLSNLEIIDPSYFDMQVGYPFSENANLDSLREVTRADYQKHLTLQPILELYGILNNASFNNKQQFDEKFLLDKRFNFSYQSLHDALLRDARHTLTQEEIFRYWLEEESQKPFAILEKLKTPFGLSRQIKSLDAKMYSPFIDTQLVYKSKWEMKQKNILGTNPIFLANDSCWALVLAKKKQGKWSAQHFQGKFDYYPTYEKETQYAFPGRRNNVEYIPGQPTSNYFMLREMKYVYQASTPYRQPNQVKVFEYDNPTAMPAVFSLPQDIQQYDVVFEFLNETTDGNLVLENTVNSTRSLPILHKEELLLQDQSFVYASLYNPSYILNPPIFNKNNLGFDPKKKLLITPVQKSDLNANGKPEVWRAAYAANEMVYIEVFEFSKNGVEVIQPNEVFLKKLKSYPGIQVYAEMSASRFLPKKLKNNMEESGAGAQAPVVRNNFSNEDAILYPSVWPEYPGGEEARDQAMFSNTIYPEFEKKNKIQGTVYLSFIVEKDGSISDIRIERSIKNGPGLSQAAIDAVKKLKRYKPGMLDGKPVRVKLTLPIRFKLN